MKRKTDIRQHDKSDCAAACIASLARFYGRDIPIAIIREASGTSVAGTSIKGILDACRQTGFEACAFKSPDKKVEALQNLDEPVILHTVNKFDDLHFIVLYRMGKKKALVMDPSTGTHHKITIDQLSREWTGFLVTMRPDPDSGTTLSYHNNSKTLANYLRYISARDFIGMLAGSLVYIVAGICTALFLQHIIDDVIPGGDTASLVRVGALMLGIMTATLSVGYGRTIYALRLSTTLDSKLTVKYLDRLFGLPVSFFTRRGAGELNSRIGDISKIRRFVIEGFSNILSSIMILIVSFTLMFNCHWRLSVLMLSFIPVYLLLYVFSDRVSKKVNRDIIENSAAFEEKTVEGISAVRIIKYYGGKDIVMRNIRRQYATLISKLFSGGKKMTGFATCSDAISKIMTTALLTVGSLFIFSGSLTIGELVSFYALSSCFSAPLGELVGINSILNDARIASERLNDIMDLEAEEDSGETLPIPDRGDIIFDNVSFSYPGAPQLLEGFNLKIERGKITAIQGESGCGKSSLAALLMRDYKVQKGAIRIGCVDIGHTELAKWRQYASIVPQDPILLNCSILDNVTCLDTEPDIEKVALILDDLGLRKFISELPMGLLTRIGERGCSLSGGQRQRIAMARALYRDPKLLILDEATSSLDEASQQYILDKLKCLRDEGRSIVMITHKNDNASIADKVFHMT